MFREDDAGTSAQCGPKYIQAQKADKMKVNYLWLVSPDKSAQRAGAVSTEGIEWFGFENGSGLCISRAQSICGQSVKDEDALPSLHGKRSGQRDGVFFEASKLSRNQVYNRHHLHMLVPDWRSGANVLPESAGGGTLKPEDVDQSRSYRPPDIGNYPAGNILLPTSEVAAARYCVLTHDECSPRAVWNSRS